MSLMSAKKLLMAGRRAKPFVLFGGWDTGNEGWVASPSGARLATDAPRSTPNAWQFSTVNGYIEYKLEKAKVSGIRLNVSVYYQNNAQTNRIAIQYRYDGDADVTTVVSVLAGSGYRLLSGSFTPDRGKDVYIRIGLTQAQNVVLADDWRIEGVRP